MELSPDDIYSLISNRLPDFKRTGRLQRLEGGNLNHVWRLIGENRNLIIKHAPPYIAANPDMPLSSSRLDFEAEALKLFGPSEKLHQLSSGRIRPPFLYFHEPDHALLVMEDIGPVPALDAWVNKKTDSTGIGDRLGHFIGKLHKTTFRDEDLRSRFNNKPIQQTRNQVQYLPAADYAAEVDQTSNDLLRSRTTSLGQLLLQPGRCLVMGDLWPPSILVKDGNLRIIDWEFVHYGRPLQDVGHFAAHCWMQAHTASSTREAQCWKQLWEVFWEKYRSTTAGLFSNLFDDKESKNMVIHIAAEILVRSVGPFKAGYVYQDLSSSHSGIKEAVKRAIQIIGSNISNIWNFLPEIPQ